MKTTHYLLIFLTFIFAISIPVAIKYYRNYTISQYKGIKGKIIESIKGLIKNYAIAYWNALISGTMEDWTKAEQAENELTQYFADANTFQYLERIHTSEIITNDIEKRELELLYLSYKTYSGNKELIMEITALSSKIEMKFNTYRTKWKGRNLTDNEVIEILETSTDSKVLEDVWTAQKAIGPLVAPDLIQLVKLRNKLAKSLGFDNYHTMSLNLKEQDPNEIFDLFDWIHQQVIYTYLKHKKDVDSILAKKYNINPYELKPWHYQDLYFQKLPKIYNHSFNQYYNNSNLEKITQEFYKSINMPIDDVMKNSDLYSKPGKSQHALCIDVDNEGDIRVLSNNVNNEKWMGTMLHEFGHAAYEKYISRELPYLLREPAHIFTTEAVAMLFQRSSRNPNFIKHFFELDNLNLKEKDFKDLRKEAALEKMVFTMWALVMYHFERLMYENPDRDLDELWWKLVEKYQMLKRPRTAPDWATKIHFSIAPCYYHNYLLGELLASQLNHYIVTKVINNTDILHPEFYGKKEVGEYLKSSLFASGLLYRWDELILKATGSKLKGEYYLNELYTGLNLGKGINLD